ncbi:MAG: hypothetical protein Q8930_12650 [Bacillota bacterium]|nr:hypothetical protein [Bacillota bacterium]
MKKIFHLINFELNNVLKKLLFLCFSMILTEIILLCITISNGKNYYLRFEDLLKTAGYPVIFFLFLAVLLALLIFNFYCNFFGSREIYTLMTLPGSRNNLFYSKFTCSVLSILFYTAVQIAGIYFSYFVVYSTIPEDIPVMNNALLLAFLRSDFLRIILPLDPFSLSVSIICLVSISAAVNFAVICERSRKIFRAVFILIIIFIDFISVFPLYEQTIWKTLFCAAIIIVCTVYMIQYSVKALKSSLIL